jgi:deoxyribodipyrimidine photo-lyase
MTDSLIIHWFRQDLRLADNPALFAAAEQGKVLPVYILDDKHAGKYRMGAASRCWLHHSLAVLNQALDHKLQIYNGHPETILLELVQQYHATAIHWNRCYEPWRVQRDSHIKQTFKHQGIKVQSFNGCLLWEPWQLLKKDNTAYQVFTPFYRNAQSLQAPQVPLQKPDNLDLIALPEQSQSIESLNLLPKIPWDKSLMMHWNAGEIAAQQTLQSFLNSGIDHYKQGRDFPALAAVSRLSPYLHFGELSANQAWYAMQLRKSDDNTVHFRNELAWREFSYSQLYHHPELAEKNLQTKFDAFPWQENPEALSRWQKGQTGIPIVDAGMRELWQTGYMHNRVRMIVASFLVKNLLLPWQQGEQWFWDCLLDADMANNSASWQWVAGCGADAAPYFRIFNPVSQGQKFDTQGEYTRRYVPELNALPDKYLFNPWEAPINILQSAGIELGKSYPKPIVDLKLSRTRALEAFKSLKKTA